MWKSVRALLRWCNRHPLWRITTVPVWGSRMRAPTFDRWLALRLHQFRLMGVDDEKFLRTHVRAGMTVVDIGANQGLYSLLLAKLAGAAGSVWAFEPDDLLYGALEKNVALNRAASIKTYRMALGSASKVMMLHRSLFNSGDNRLATTRDRAREVVSVQVERLDQVLADHSVDFIKMDVQGWEMEVFRGMQGLLDEPRNAVLTIYFEFWPEGLRSAGCEPAEPLRFLTTNGFSVHRTQGGGAGTAVEDINALASSLAPGTYTNLCAIRSRKHTVDLGHG